MNVPGDARLLADALGVLYAECGAETTRRLFDEATERLKPLPAPKTLNTEASPCCPTSDVDHALWHEMLRGLAVLRPELFGAHLAELGDAPRGDALAFLYVREHHSQQLARYRGPAGERMLVARARAALAEAVADTWRMRDRPAPDFAREPEVWIVRPSCPLLHAYVVEFQHFAGLSLAPHEAVRDVVLIPEAALHGHRRRGVHPTAALLLHEGIHGSLADAAEARPDAYCPRLTGLVDEAVVEVLSLAALHLLAPHEPQWVRFRNAALEWRAGLGLLSFMPGLKPSDLARAAELGVANLSAGGAETSVQLLNGLTGGRWDELDYCFALANEHATLTVDFGDGATVVCAGAQSHIERAADANANAA